MCEVVAQLFLPTFDAVFRGPGNLVKVGVLVGDVCVPVSAYANPTDAGFTFDGWACDVCRVMLMRLSISV